MRRLFRIALRVFLVLIALALAAGGYLWWKLRPRVEPIPQVLAAVETGAALDSLVIPGEAEWGLPDLSLAAQRGSTVYFQIEGRESAASGEGRAMSLALNRWQFPPDVKGYLIGDVEGLGVFAWKIREYADLMRREARLPLYLDYEGALLRAFKLPKGHPGLAVLGPDGAIRFRHAGPMDETTVEQLREVLGATEPPPPPRAPAFSIGPLSTESCRERVCAFVFLGDSVQRSRVPGIEGGFEGDAAEMSTLFQDPSIRLVAMLSAQGLPSSSRGLFVGALEGVALATGWEQLAEDARARAQFGLSAGDAALVVVDAQGRLAHREVGRMPAYKLPEVLALLRGPDAELQPN